MRTEEQQREYDAAMEQEAMSQGEYMSAAVRQWAGVYGEDRPDDRWVLSPFDTWENNPHWNGTDPYQPHPEDEYAQEEYYVVGQHAVNLYWNQVDADTEAAAAELYAEEQYDHDEDLPF